MIAGGLWGRHFRPARSEVLISPPLSASGMTASALCDGWVENRRLDELSRMAGGWVPSRLGFLTAGRWIALGEGWELGREKAHFGFIAVYVQSSSGLKVLEQWQAYRLC